MKTIVITLFALAAAVLFAYTAFSQEDMRYVQDSYFEKTIRPPAFFEHDIHNENAELEDCSLCHHVWEDGKLVEGESSEGTECGECHAAENPKDIIPLTDRFHRLCKSCHMEKKQGPVMCHECHGKE